MQYLLRSVLLAVPLAFSLIGRVEGAPIIIWDQSPAALGGTAAGGGAFLNSDVSQNFSELVMFSTAQLVTGMDIYTENAFANVSDLVTVRIRTPDRDGAPVEFGEAIAIEDTDGVGGAFPQGTVRVHVDFDVPFALLANTRYFFGMSGEDDDLGQYGIAGGASSFLPLDGSMSKYNGPHYLAEEGGDMAFRLFGADAQVVPEPETLALLGIGLSGLVFFRRRKNITRSAMTE